MSATMRTNGREELRAASDSGRPGEKPLAVIETDLFCRNCGYNLHAQRVWRDSRLGVMVCRCPECGLHEAADVASGIGNMWSRQFGQFILALWVCVIAAGSYWAVSSLSYAQVGYVTFNEAPIDGTSATEKFAQRALSLSFEVIQGFWLAATVSVLLLHRKRAWGYVSAVLPLAALVWTLATQSARHPHYGMEAWQSMLNLAEFVCFQLSGFLLGAALGRSAIRRIAAWALPAWALRAIAFLWLAEGKKLPAQAQK